METCKRGHPWTPENTYIKPSDGKRRCRECKRGLESGLYVSNRQGGDHCERGHPRTPENTHIRPDNGKRYCRECHRETAAEWKRAHQEERRESKAKWYHAHQEEQRERARVYNPKWRAANPEKAKDRSHRYRAQMKGPPDAATLAHLEAIKNDPCHWCGGLGESDDHVIPLTKGGRHEPGNLVRSCMPCNSSKRDRAPTIEWVIGRRMWRERQAA